MALSRALEIVQTTIGPVGFIDSEPSGMWTGYPYKWDIQLQVKSLPNSGATSDFQYDATDIKIGDWVSTSAGGFACVIVKIIEVLDAQTILVTVEDQDFYNILNDPNFSGNGIGTDGAGIVFPMDEVSGIPVLGPVSSFAFDLNLQMDLFSRFIQEQRLKGGGSATLGEPTDGNLEDGAIKGWKSGETTITDAIDQLNMYILRTSPDKPPGMDEAVIHFNNESPFSENVLLANGVFPVNTDGLFPYLTEMAGIGDTRTSTVRIEDVGLGDTGKLTARLNGEVIGEATLKTTSDVGTYDSLEILEDYVYPRGSKSFWTALAFQASSEVPDGISLFEFEHSITGKTNRYFVNENMFETPVISGNKIAVDNTNIVYSSGVPHLTQGSTMKFSMTASHLAGRTIPKTNSMNVMTDPNIGSTSINYNHAQFPAIISINHGPIAVVDEELMLDVADIATQALVRFEARNSFKENVLISDIAINYIGGTYNLGDVYETNPTLKRVRLPDTDKPVVDTIDFATDWNSGSGSSLGDLASWEAPIVGGHAVHSQTDFSVGYVPPGPDFTDKAATQYITFKFQSITNRIKLSIIGQFSGMWIKLPGVTADMPNAENGWWDATKQADFAPTLWPGHILASDGCLLDTVGGVTSFTFGSVSSVKATDNIILIRFKLVGGDYIDSIQVV